MGRGIIVRWLFVVGVATQTAAAGVTLSLIRGNLDAGHGVHDTTFTNVQRAAPGTLVTFQVNVQADLAGGSHFLQVGIGPQTGTWSVINTLFSSTGVTDCFAPFQFNDMPFQISAADWNSRVDGGAPGDVYLRAEYSSSVQKYCFACTNCNCLGSPQCDLPQTQILISYTAGPECQTNADCTNPTPFCSGGACVECTSGSHCSDGNACTSDVCSGNVCSNANRSSGTSCGNSNNTDCTNPDTCNGFGTCLSNHEPNGTPCGADGNECSDDICNALGICTHPDKPEGTPCDDAVFCNGTDMCSNGACAHTGNPCDPGEDCCEVTGSCTACCSLDSECDDALFCNGAEICNAMLNCQAGASPVIDDGVPCTDDSCDEVNDVVVNTPNDANCDDGVGCTTDSCDPVNPNAGPDGCLLVSTCDDMIACTIDSCDPSDLNADPNGCIFVADDSNCPILADVCKCDSCDPIAGCNPPRIYGDVNCSGNINLFDLFCVLDGFSGVFENCTFSNVDIMSCPQECVDPCVPDGKINLFDLFAVLDTFNGVDPCCSPAPLGFFASGLAVGPPPGGPATIGMTMSAVPASGSAGDLFDVEVFGGEFANLRGYEIGLSASGGTTGSLTLEDIVVDELRSDYVFAGLGPFQSFDTSTVRMLNALDGDAVASLTAKYLATFKFRASADASGTFTVSARPDPDTFAVDSSSTKMTVVIVSDTQITIS